MVLEAMRRLEDDGFKAVLAPFVADGWRATGNATMADEAVGLAAHFQRRDDAAAHDRRRRLDAMKPVPA